MLAANTLQLPGFLLGEWGLGIESLAQFLCWAELEPCHAADDNSYYRPFPDMSRNEDVDQSPPQLKPIERIVKSRVNNENGHLGYL